MNGKMMRGHKRFTPDDVRAIRMSPLKDRDLADQFGVSHVAIWNIRNGKTYKWVDGNGLARPGREGKLAPSQVRFIRQSALSWPILSERFGLCEEMIRRIKRKISYAEVADEKPGVTA